MTITILSVITLKIVNVVKIVNYPGIVISFSLLNNRLYSKNVHYYCEERLFTSILQNTKVWFLRNNKTLNLYG